MSSASSASGRGRAARPSVLRRIGAPGRPLVTLELVTGATGLVGGGFLLAGWWQWHARWHARELSMAAGAGLVCFEAAELAWLGFQPLEAVFAVVGVMVTGLAWRLPRPREQAGRGLRGT